jgi:pyruvate,water dikinase
VAPLEAIGRHDLERVGGKGANLGELVRGGFPVPAGFVVTTAAYERFVDQARLGGRVADALGAGGDAAARAIRDAFLAATIPEEIRQAVSAAYRDLAAAPAGEPPQVPVAVRSSATAEDLAQAAFAGQQDTYLNVVGLDELLDALCAVGRRCGPPGLSPTGAAWDWRTRA